jgi:hypothetical protein
MPMFVWRDMKIDLRIADAWPMAAVGSPTNLHVGGVLVQRKFAAVLAG